MYKKIFILLCFLLTTYFFLSCSEKDNSVGPSGSSPIKPYINSVHPIASEPRRGLSIGWVDYSDNEKGFTLQRKKYNSSGAFANIANLPKNTESYADWGLDIYETYVYRISSHNDYGSSEFSNEHRGTTNEYLVSEIQLSVTEDAYVSEENPNRNFGSSNVLLVKNGDLDSDDIMRSYLKFNYGEIPSYAYDIDEATLILLTQDEERIGSGLEVSISGVEENWNENSITWNTKPLLGNHSNGDRIINDGRFIYFDASGVLRSWKKNGMSNYGIGLRPLAEVRNYPHKGIGVVFSKEFAPGSGYTPILKVKYLW